MVNESAERAPIAADSEVRVARPLWRAPLIAGAAVGGGCAAIALANPTDTGVPICWSQGVFGIDCPLCGGLRCVNALVRGDLGAAADHNVILAVVLPVVAVIWAIWLVQSMRGRRFRLPPPPRWSMLLAAVAVVGFTVLRNAGGSGWTGWLASTLSAT